MNRAMAVLFLAAVLAGCASRPPIEEGCSHAQELPPLRLTSEHKQLLSKVTTPPKTALDYYMLLPKATFRIMPDSRERRVTYIDSKTLSDDYLHASRWFECDGGGFSVTLKLYRTPSQTFVVVQRRQPETIFDDGKPREGEPSVSIDRPELWQYSAGQWVRLPDASIPKISARHVLAKYHHDWDADQQYRGQDKFIWIDYVLSPATDDIVLMGRENFQSDIYEYARLKWQGDRFSFE